MPYFARYYNHRKDEDFFNRLILTYQDGCGDFYRKVIARAPEFGLCNKTALTPKPKTKKIIKTDVLLSNFMRTIVAIL